MKRRIGVALLLSLALVVTSVVVAQDGGAKDGDKPADKTTEKTAPSRSRARLVKPWADLTTLTPEQKDQIMRIHAEAVDKINEIRDKEEADILAVLTPEQHRELDAMKEKQKADQKAKRAAAAAAAKADDDKDKDKPGEPKDK